MTDNERAALKKRFVQTALYFGQSVPDDVLDLYVRDLDDLPFVDVVKAMTAIRRDPTTRRCPLPSVIRQRIQPAQTDEQRALDAVSLIVMAISKVGPYRTQEARALVGDLGWLVVEREGGWQHVCEMLTDENVGTLRAQWRELAKALSVRSRAGLTDPPKLEGPDGTPVDVKGLLPEMPK